MALSCQDCGGRGWRLVESVEGSSAERCHCYRQGDETRRLGRAGVPQGLLHCDFESFEVAGNEIHLAAARGAARGFVEQYPLTGKGGLLFHGPVGSGKTHLAVAIVRELVLSKGARALFVDFRGLLKTIQDSWNPVSQTSEKEVLKRVLDADLLVLDDVGAEKPSDWVRETVAYVISERYNRGKPMIITTNLLLDSKENPESGVARREMSRRVGLREKQVDVLEDRLGVASLSRLCEMCVNVPLAGVEDFRRAHKTPGGRKGWSLG